jgi:hypothetical protein
MTYIKEMLINNRSLKSFSCMNNVFNHIGIHSFLEGMKVNATLLSCNFSYNERIGALGCKCLGDLLYYNNTIQNLEMNAINMFSGGNLSGLSSLCYGIQKSTSLVRLTLSKNNITEYHLMTLAEALFHNNRLLIFDLTNNFIQNDLWFQRDTFLTTQLKKDQPSIATLLYRNSLFLAKQGKKISDVIKEFSVPQHSEQLQQVNEWRQSIKISKDQQERKKHEEMLFLTRTHTPQQHQQHHHQQGEKSFSPYQSPVYPFRSTPLHSRPESPDYCYYGDFNTAVDESTKSGLAPPPVEYDVNGNLKVFSDKRKNALISIPAPTSNRFQISSIVDNVKYGYWTSRRLWRKLPVDTSEKENAEKAKNIEYERILTEKAYLRKTMKEYISAISLYLEETPCQQFLLTIAKVFTEYCKEFSSFSILKDNLGTHSTNIDDIHHLRNPNEVNLFKHASFPSSSGMSMSMSMKTTVSFELEEDKGGQSMKGTGRNYNPTSPTAKTRKEKQEKEEKDKTITTATVVVPTKKSSSFLSLFSSSNPSFSSSSSSPVSSLTSLMHKQFMNIHISFCQSIFTLLESGNKTLLLHPEKLETAMNMLTLPVSTIDQLQEITDKTLIPSIERIGFHKFTAHLLLHSRKLSKNNKIKRKKLLWDLYFHPPIIEAKTMILYYLTFNALKVFRKQYRSNTLNRPKYVCTICLERFTSEKELQSHLSHDILNTTTGSSPNGSPHRSSSSSNHPHTKSNKFGEYGANALPTVKKKKRNTLHKRLLMEESIYESHHLLLKEVKYHMTGVYFPAYYELLPNHLLPENYYPQIFDKIGKAGRPITVLEPFRTIRALDVLGKGSFLFFLLLRF